MKAPATILLRNNTNYRIEAVGTARTFNERDDPTGGARMKNQNALNDKEVQRQ
jgi:hypothetical protein